MLPRAFQNISASQLLSPLLPIPFFTCLFVGLPASLIESPGMTDSGTNGLGFAEPLGDGPCVIPFARNLCTSALRPAAVVGIGGCWNFEGAVLGRDFCR